MEHKVLQVEEYGVSDDVWQGCRTKQGRLVLIYSVFSYSFVTCVINAS